MLIFAYDVEDCSWSFFLLFYEGSVVVWLNECSIRSVSFPWPLVLIFLYRSQVGVVGLHSGVLFAAAGGDVDDCLWSFFLMFSGIEGVFWG